MVYRCCVPFCRNKRDVVKPGVSFHNFTRDPQFIEQWTQKIKQACSESPFIISKHTKICSEHFIRENFLIKSEKSRLKPDAVPSVFSCVSANIAGVDMAEEAVKQEDLYEENEDSQEMDDSNEVVQESTKPSGCGLIPEKSRKRYEETYKLLRDWLVERNFDKEHVFPDEDLIIEWFKDLSNTLKPTTLWTYYSMLKVSICAKHEFDISNFRKLRTFLKQHSAGYEPKKAKTFTAQEIRKFIDEAPDSKYLLVKVALIIGTAGACRREDLAMLKFNHIKDFGSGLLVTITPGGPKGPRSFTITGNSYETCKKYMALRPKKVEHGRFFLNYLRERCTVQPVGINKFAFMAKQIANYLELPSPESYTGCCFRRTSTIISVSLLNSAKTDGRKSTASSDSDDDCTPQLCQEITVNDVLSFTNVKEEVGVEQKIEDSNSGERRPLITPETNITAREEPIDKSNDEESVSFVNQLPLKSRAKYLRTYQSYKDWLDLRNYKRANSSTDQDHLIEYFDELSKKVKPTTLWTHYAVLRSCLSLKHDVDIYIYKGLRTLLKLHTNGYEPKKTKTLSTEEIRKFLNEAPDGKYLLIKVVLIFGIAGACGREELVKMMTDNMIDSGTDLLVKTFVPRSQEPRFFKISGRFYKICKKYWALRPDGVLDHRFFVNFQRGKCTRQPIGKNKFGNMPKEIAKYLRLPDPQLYTGKCFKRSSARLTASAKEERQHFNKLREEVRGNANRTDSDSVSLHSEETETEEEEESDEDVNMEIDPFENDLECEPPTDGTESATFNSFETSPQTVMEESEEILQKNNTGSTLRNTEETTMSDMLRIVKEENEDEEDLREVCNIEEVVINETVKEERGDSDEQGKPCTSIWGFIDEPVEDKTDIIEENGQAAAVILNKYCKIKLENNIL